ncbi:MAG: hypothetical protein ACPGWR_20705 [Ardenticatenaceae bacterium]
MAHTYAKRAEQGTCPAKSDTYPAKSETVSLCWLSYYSAAEISQQF